MKHFLLGLSALLLIPSKAQTIQTYTTPGNYTFVVPSGITTLSIEVIGAGGKGISNGGGGGGGGGYASGVYTATPGASLAVKVGSPNVNPTVGTSSVSNFISATGGSNGTSLSTNTIIGGAGAGGNGSGGTINRAGGAGGDGCWTYFGAGGGGAAGPTSNGGAGGNTPVWNGSNCNTPGGTGGGGVAGNGGKGAGFTNSGCTTSNPAVNGSSFGGGGGAGNGNGSPESLGAGGYVSISYTTCPTPSGINLGPGSSTICAGSTQFFGGGSLPSGSVLTWTIARPGPVVITSTLFPLPFSSTVVTSHTITASITNSCGSTSTVSLPYVMIVQPLPTITAVSSNSIICNGQSATLTASGGITYTWVPTIPLSGVVSPTINTVYTVTGSNSLTCIKMETVSISVSPCTGLDEIGSSKNVMVYPNPNQGVFTVKAETGSRLRIYDAYGRCIVNELAKEKETVIRMDAFARGLYTLTLETNNRRYAFKISKE